jgi:TIR domain
MAVFLSWSGARSKDYATNFNEWLSIVVPGVPIFFSPDIEGGRRSFAAIEEGLRSCTYGVCCLTPDNLDSTWLHFEAGAISNALSRNAGGPPPIVPLLFDGLTNNQVKPPLSQFQTKCNTKNDLLSIALAVNAARIEGQIGPHIVTTLFEKFWSDYDEKASSIAVTPTTTAPKREVSDIVEEILDIVRTQTRSAYPTMGNLYQTAMEQHFLAAEARSEVQERAIKNGLKVDGGGPYGPDLIIDDIIFIEVKAVTDTFNVADVCYAADTQLTSHRQRMARTDAHGVIVIAARHALRTMLAFHDVMKLDKAVVWYSGESPTFGNTVAKGVVPWLVDNLF